MSHFPWRDFTVALLFLTVAMQSGAIWLLMRQIQKMAIVLTALRSAAGVHA